MSARSFSPFSEFERLDQTFAMDGKPPGVFLFRSFLQVCLDSKYIVFAGQLIEKVSFEFTTTIRRMDWATYAFLVLKQGKKLFNQLEIGFTDTPWWHFVGFWKFSTPMLFLQCDRHIIASVFKLYSLFFSFILPIHEGSHREVYQEFQPSYDIFHRWCQGLFRPQVLCTLSLHCPIASSALTQSQQPV